MDCGLTLDQGGLLTVGPEWEVKSQQLRWLLHLCT